MNEKSSLGQLPKLLRDVGSDGKEVEWLIVNLASGIFYFLLSDKEITVSGP